MKGKFKNMIVTIVSGIALMAMSWNDLNTMRLTSIILLGLIFIISYKIAVGDVIVSGDEDGK